MPLRLSQLYHSLCSYDHLPDLSIRYLLIYLNVSLLVSYLQSSLSNLSLVQMELSFQLANCWFHLFDQLESEAFEWSTETYVLMSPPGNFNAHWSLRSLYPLILEDKNWNPLKGNHLNSTMLWFLPNLVSYLLSLYL